VNNMNLIEAFSLFMYGAITFASPCSLGLIIAYLSFILGADNTREEGALVGASFTLAMTLTFFIIGVLIASLVPVNLSSKIPYILTGIMLMLFGLNTYGVFDRYRLINDSISAFDNAVSQSRTKVLKKVASKGIFLPSFTLGVVISIALGPCSLAIVLPAIMASLFTAATPFHAGLILAVFGLGHAAPVAVLCVLVTQARTMFASTLIKRGEILSKLIGAGLFVFGLYLLYSNSL